MSNLTWDYRAPTTLMSDFPQLAELADGAAALVRLGAAFGAGMSSCEVRTVRYIAGRALEAVYRLSSGDLIAVRFLRPGMSRAVYEAALGTASAPALVRHLADWDAVAWRLPADPGGLPVADLMARTSVLAGGPASCTVLAYLPGERLAVRCAPAGRAGVVGKLRAGPGAAASHAAAQRLWSTPRRRLRLPEPLGADEGRGMRWERFVPGLRLEHALADGDPADLLGELAGGLAELHARAPDDLPAQGPPDVLRRIEKVLRRLNIALPSVAGDARALATCLAACEPHAGRAATIHGDLHTANVIVAQHGPVLIDLDSLAAGDPAYDLAMLGSRMILSAALRGEPLGRACALAASLPAHYAAAGGAPCAPCAYAWYLAALLLARQVKTCLSNAAPASLSIVTSLIAVAAETLAGTGAA